MRVRAAAIALMLLGAAGLPAGAQTALSTAGDVGSATVRNGFPGGSGVVTLPVLQNRHLGGDRRQHGGEERGDNRFGRRWLGRRGRRLGWWPRRKRLSGRHRERRVQPRRRLQLGAVPAERRLGPCAVPDRHRPVLRAKLGGWRRGYGLSRSGCSGLPSPGSSTHSAVPPWRRQISAGSHPSLRHSVQRAGCCGDV